jgi:enterochelin esterase-like enzyme
MDVRRSEPLSCRSLLWSAFQVAVGALLLFLVACWRIGGELPTVAPTVDVPPTALAGFSAYEGTLPATFTPLASRIRSDGQSLIVGTPAATSTLPPAVGIPLAQLPPTSMPTPFVAPEYLMRPVNVREYSSPPTLTDCNGTGTVFQSRFPSNIGGPWRSYHAYLPPCYGQDGRAYPVLFLFHGSGWSDDQWVQLGVAQHIDQGIAEGRYPPFVVIMPMFGDIDDTTSGGPRSVEGVVLDNLVPYVEENFCAWKSRDGRSLGGISRGGYWALMLAFRHTDLFGTVSGHSSQLRLDVDPPEYNPRATYAQADLSDTEIWMDWGSSDFLRPGQLYLHESLMNAGIAHRAEINPGGHAQYYWYAHVQEYLDWHASQWSLDRESYPFCDVAATQ